MTYNIYLKISYFYTKYLVQCIYALGMFEMIPHFLMIYKTSMEERGNSLQLGNY